MKRLLVTLAVVSASAGVGAQDFPSRAITLVVPFPAGGPSDALARQVAQRLGVRLAQQVLIENVAGAGGTLGLAKVTRSAPDGHTLGFGTIGTHVANVALYRKLPYDPVADFEPVGMVGSAPMVLVATPSVPAGNLPEFVSWLAANKGRTNFGSAGNGSISHFGCIMLLSALGQDVTHVPYKGVAPAMTDVMGGQVNFMCDQTTTALPMIEGGKLKPIAALTRSRIGVLPNLPTAAEAGYADVDVRSWNAIFAPKGTPASVVARLNGELSAVMADRGFREAMEKVGVELPSGPGLAPAVVTATIQQGLRRDVPALKARADFLD